MEKAFELDGKWLVYGACLETKYEECRDQIESIIYSTAYLDYFTEVGACVTDIIPGLGGYDIYCAIYVELPERDSLLNPEPPNYCWVSGCTLLGGKDLCTIHHKQRQEPDPEVYKHHLENEKKRVQEFLANPYPPQIIESYTDNNDNMHEVVFEFIDALSSIE